MARLVQFTSKITKEPVTVDIDTVNGYRGNTGYTSIYRGQEEPTLFVSETFEQVDDAIEAVGGLQAKGGAR